MESIIPLLVFTVFGGTAAGAATCAAVCGDKKPDSASATGAKPRGSAAVPLICLVLLAIGLLGTLFHLGQPLRFLNGMSNPASMIAQEAYWAIGLGVLLVAWAALALRGRTPRALVLIAGVAALGLVTVTSLAYFLSWGIPAWNGAATFLVIAIGDIALGIALCALLMKAHRGTLIAASAAAGGLSILAAVAFYAQLAAAHAAFDATGYAVAAGLIAGAAPIGVWLAWKRGGLDGKMASIVVLIAVVVGTVALRLAFFLAGIGA